jgi:hypothetical protein
MFDCSLYSAEGIREAADLRHEIVEYQIAHLSLLGYKRDIEFIFPDGYGTPDFDYSDGLPEEAREIVRNVYLLTEDIERAERELRLRARPN